MVSADLRLQMSHSSSSEKLPQILQYFTFFLTSKIAVAKFCASASSDLHIDDFIRKSLSRFRSDPGQFRKLVYKFADRFDINFHLLKT